MARAFKRPSLKFSSVLCLVLLLSSVYSLAHAEDITMVRANLGTDISAGLGYGVGLRFLERTGSGTAFEFGPDLYMSKSTYTTEETHTYEETTELTVFAVRVNQLSGYRPGSDSRYFIYGAGAAAINVNWNEKSATDTSLGTPCCGGGSMQSEEGTAFTGIINVGVGKSSNGMDLRLEFPMLIFFSPVGGAAAIAPTMTVSAGFNI